MQKLITKYGLAAHLAFLAVAPLFLSSSCILWLSGLVAVWVLMEPSRFGDEMLHDARKRVAHAIFTDPLFWLSVVVVGYAAVRFANGGVSMSYDAELAVWSVSNPTIPILPGSTDASGYQEFAASVAMLVILQGCRHALGRAARMAFLLISSALAGVSVVCFAVMLFSDVQGAKDLLVCGTVNPAYLGSAMGVYLVVGIVALVAAYERKWLKAMPLTLLSVGGTAAGLFLLAPPMVQVVFAAAALLVLIYSFAYARNVLTGSGEFKFLVSFSLAIVLGGVMVMFVVPDQILLDKIAVYKTGDFLNEGFLTIRGVLSDISLKVWKAHPWVGTGLGSFPIDLRFNATDEVWAVVVPEQIVPLNGYWLILVERGIVGAVMPASMLCFLLWTFGRRLAWGILLKFPHPACWIGVFVLIAFLAETAVDVSFTLPGMFTAIMAMLALSANSFPKEERNG